MKNLTQKGIFLFFLSAVTIAPIASYAQVGSSLAAEVTGTANLEAVVNQTVGHTTVGTDMSTGVIVDSDTVHTNSTTTVNTDSDTEVYVGSDEDGMLQVNSEGVAIVTSAQVHNESDLALFESNMPVKYERVAKIDVDSNNDGETEVVVVYRNQGKLFGFIPVTVKSITTAKVNDASETEITSRMSWWSFLVANKNHSKAEVEERVRNNPAVQANLKANASAQAKAAVAEAIVAEVSAHAEANGSVQG